MFLSLFFSMNLYELIKKNNFQGFSIALIRRFAFSLLQCLKLLQREKIIHCDLKPVSILYTCSFFTNITGTWYTWQIFLYFYYIKVGFKGSKLYRYVFVMISKFHGHFQTKTKISIQKKKKKNNQHKAVRGVTDTSTYCQWVRNCKPRKTKYHVSTLFLWNIGDNKVGLIFVGVFSGELFYFIILDKLFYHFDYRHDSSTNDLMCRFQLTEQE